MGRFVRGEFRNLGQAEQLPMNPFLRFLFALFLLGMLLPAQAQRYAPNEPSLPVIHHPGYSLAYDESSEQAAWVAYCLTAGETVARVERSNDFRSDPSVRSGSAAHSDYKGSGYDRGHLAPAADLAWSSASMSASFFYSNMSPQLPGFNRGIWKKLEELMRSWARVYDSVYVVTGPLYLEQGGSIGPNAVRIPSHYFKAVLTAGANKRKAIAFVLPNASSKAPLSSFALPVDRLENYLGRDLFAFLPDGEEQALESTLCIPCWSWTATKGSSAPRTKGTTAEVQCQGTIQKGARCKRRTKNASGFCWQHE